MIDNILNFIDKKKPINIYDNSKDNMVLRDFLALDRTIMANERTFLAWFRTAISLIAGGLAIIKFSEDLIFLISGVILIGMGFVIGLIGTIRYIRIHKRLAKIKF